MIFYFHEPINTFFLKKIEKKFIHSSYRILIYIFQSIFHLFILFSNLTPSYHKPSTNMYCTYIPSILEHVQYIALHIEISRLYLDSLLEILSVRFFFNSFLVCAFFLSFHPSISFNYPFLFFFPPCCLINVDINPLIHQSINLVFRIQYSTVPIPSMSVLYRRYTHSKLN